MKLIIPMAGRGSRLRPHTLHTPKPLLPIAGKPIVQRLAEDIVEIYDGNIEEIAFIIGAFGKDVEAQLHEIAARLGTTARICYQDEPLGTAHAIWQAEASMDGEVIIAFADTLFRADFKLNQDKDGTIWVKKVEDPRAYGVVTLNAEGVIDELVEKPQEFVSDLAIIGIYHLMDGPQLRSEIKHLLDNDIREKGEYQLTNALENMKAKGAQLMPGEVDEWMDCGNKAAVLDTMQRVLGFEEKEGKPLVASSATVENSVVIPPCYIGEDAKIINSVIGPFASIGANTEVRNCIIKASALRENTVIHNAVLDDAMIGSNASVKFKASDLSISDYSTL